MDASKLQNEEPITQIDWQQVILNGGPPCFFVEGPQYCGRAERWPGHGNEAFHDYVSLDDLLVAKVKEEREAAFKEAIEIAKEVQQRCAASAISQQAFGAAKVVSALETTMGREVKTGNDN